MKWKCCGAMMRREKIKRINHKNKEFINPLKKFSTFKILCLVLVRILFFISTSIDGDDLNNK
jgi:hypothetical protein